MKGDTSVVPSYEWDVGEFGIVHGALLAAMYHMIRAESEHEKVTNILDEIIVNDITQEYAEEHGVYAPLHVSIQFNFPSPEGCESLDSLRAKVEDNEQLQKTT